MWLIQIKLTIKILMKKLDINKIKYERFTKRVDELKMKIIKKNRELAQRERERNWNVPCQGLYEIKVKFTRTPRTTFYNYDKYGIFKNHSVKNFKDIKIGKEFQKFVKRLQTSRRPSTSHNYMSYLTGSHSTSNIRSNKTEEDISKSIIGNYNQNISARNVTSNMKISKKFCLLSPSKSVKTFASTMNQFSPQSKNTIDQSLSIEKNQKKKKKEKIVSSSYKIVSNKVKNLPLYTVKIGDLVQQMKQIKTQMKKESIQYKSRHFMSYQDIDNLIETRKQMKILQLKQKYFNCKFPEPIMYNNRTKQKILKELKEDYEILEREHYQNQQIHY